MNAIKKHLFFIRAIVAATSVGWFGYACVAEVKHDVVTDVQPARSAGVVFDILATVRRLYPDSVMLLFHEDGRVCYGAIRLDRRREEYLVIVDPKILDRLELLVDGVRARFGDFVIRAYGQTWDEGKWVQNDTVGEYHVGYVVKIPDGKSFSLTCHVPRMGSHGGFSLAMSRDGEGVWRANAKVVDKERTQSDDLRPGGSKGTPSE